MQIQNFIDIYLLLLFALISCSIFLLISSNSVHSVLYLILCFFHSSIILFLFNVEFLGLAFIIIYVGAIAVLFLFVVMMLNVKQDSSEITFQEIVIPLVFFVFFYLVFKNTFSISDLHFFYFFSFFDLLTNITILGQLLYNYSLSDILIAGFVLLIAIIGPVILTLQFNNKKGVGYRQLSRSDDSITFLHQV